jgi:hypothetical protein
LNIHGRRGHRFRYAGQQGELNVFLTLQDLSNHLLDRCCPTSRHRHHHQRSLKSSYSVRLIAGSLFFLSAHHPHSSSLVAFGPKQRAIGESAKTQETTNLKNTVGCLKRLVGRTLNDSDVQQHEKKFINATLLDVGGTIGVDVGYPEKLRAQVTDLLSFSTGRLSWHSATVLCDAVDGHVFGQTS